MSAITYFKPYDWFGTALFSLALASRRKLDGTSAIDLLSTICTGSIEKKIFHDNYLYRFIVQLYNAREKEVGENESDLARVTPLLS